MGSDTTHRTRIKICGITRLEDALAAVDAGVDALGFVFYAKSPRAVSAATAADIIQSLPAFVTSVGLFLDAEASEVREVTEVAGLDLLQFHGREPAEFCESFARPYFKALGIAGVQDVAAELKAYSKARAVLLDSHAKGQAGGTGECFDWSAIPSNLNKPLILAGGLNADNVDEAVKQVRPYAVDTSSGGESSPGIKDRELIERFVARVRAADSE